MTVPAEHLTDRHKLNADAYVDLFHIILTDNSHIYIKDGVDVTWQGNDYEGVAVKLTGASRSATDEKSRPSLAVVNPMGVFSSFIRAKKLDKATVIRYRVLKAHITADQNIFRQQSWKAMRITKLDKSVITVELRDQLDGPNAIIPAREFYPPEFPTVSL